jgi:hypothetical protein
VRFLEKAPKPPQAMVVGGRQRKGARYAGEAAALSAQQTVDQQLQIGQTGLAQIEGEDLRRDASEVGVTEAVDVASKLMLPT